MGVDENATAKEIFELLIYHSLTSAKMAAGLIGRLEDAENYEADNRIADLLEKIEVWSPELFNFNPPKYLGELLK